MASKGSSHLQYDIVQAIGRFLYQCYSTVRRFLQIRWPVWHSCFCLREWYNDRQGTAFHDAQSIDIQTDR